MPDYRSDDIVMDDVPAPRLGVAILAVAGVAGLLVAATAALWMHYGTAVFFETIRAGFLACFS